MNDLYREILIKKPTTGADQIKKFGIIALTVVLALVGLLFFPPVLILAVAAGVGCYFVLSRIDIEYEYLYVNGDIDIDKIMNKQRRKRVSSYPLEELELIAPSQSHDLDSYQGKVMDFTSRNPQIQTYTAVYLKEGGRQLVKLELDPDLISDIRRHEPRKISRDCLLLSKG